MTTLEKLTIGETPFGTLDDEGRLLNAVLKEPMPKAGTFGFRGDIALKFQENVADEKRPPDYSVEQVLAVADAEKGSIPLLVGYLHSFAWFKDAGEVLAPYLLPEGKYVFFANNIDFLKKYRVPFGPASTAYVLPLDESTVWKETLELLDLDKNDVKKLDGPGKLQKVMDLLADFSADYEIISYEDGVAAMGPVRNRNENRPV